jgi:hypothetical protein
VTLYDELRVVLEALDQAGVEYALIGGLAVAVWGAPRATKDIDLLVLRDDLTRAKEALRGRGFTREALPFQFKDGCEVHRINKVDAAGNLMTVDLMMVDANLEAAWQGRTRLPLDEREVVVISRQGLIAMKARAARPQDLADIQNLQEIDPVKVEMTAAAIEARLREASRLAGSLRPEARLETKIDLTARGVERRLREASDLLELCRTLGRAGRR